MERITTADRNSPQMDTAYLFPSAMAMTASRRNGWNRRPSGQCGEAFGYEHFHDASQKDLDGFRNGDDTDLSVGRDEIIVSLVQWQVVIWMTQIE
jgi:hypothetical protein